MLIFAKQRVSSILLLGRVNHQIQVYVSNIFHLSFSFIHSSFNPFILLFFFSVTTTSISMCLVQCVICHMGYMCHGSHVTCHFSPVLSHMSYVPYVMRLTCVLCTLVWILMCWSKITFWRKNFAHTLHLRKDDILFI